MGTFTSAAEVANVRGPHLAALVRAGHSGAGEAGRARERT